MRRLGPLFFGALAFVAVSLIVAPQAGERTWWVGVMGTILCLGVLIPAASFLAHTRAALSRFMQLEDGKATIELGNGRLMVASKLGSLELPLTRVTMVWCYPEFWVLLQGRAILMTIPTGALQEPMKQAWLENLRAAGTRVA